MSIVNFDRDLRFVDQSGANSAGLDNTGLGRIPSVSVNNTVATNIGTCRYHGTAGSTYYANSGEFVAAGLVIDIPEGDDKVPYHFVGSVAAHEDTEVMFGMGERPAYSAGTIVNYDVVNPVGLTGWMKTNATIDQMIALDKPTAGNPFIFYTLIANRTAAAITAILPIIDLSVQKLNELPPTLDTRMR